MNSDIGAMAKRSMMKNLSHKIRCLFLSLVFIFPQHTQSVKAETLLSESFQLPNSLDNNFQEKASRYLELTGQIDTGYNILLENCYEDPIPSNRLGLCKNVAQNIIAAKEEIETSIIPAVQNSLPETSETCKTPEAGISVDGLGNTIKDTSETIFHQCMGASNSRILNCGKEISCSIVSTLSLAGFWRAGENSTERECISSENDCLIQFLTSFISVLVSSISGMWGLLKAGGNWAIEKGKQFWNWIASAENETSEKQELIQNFSEETVEEIEQNPESWMSKMLNGIVATLRAYPKTPLALNEIIANAK